MPDEPISNPGVSPAMPTQPPSRESPGLGAGEEAQEPKPFSLPPQPLAGKPQEVAAQGKPTPMEAVKEGFGQKNTPEQVEALGRNLVEKIQNTRQLYADPSKARGLTQDHYDAMLQTSDKLGAEMQKVGKYTNQEFEIPQKKKGQSVLQYVREYLNTSQGTAENALDFLSKSKNPNMAQLLSVQYAMQRASQKVELLASIIGSSVSGIKTLMSTQLG